MGLEQVLLLLIADGPQHRGHSLALTQLQMALLDEPDRLDSLTQALARWEGPISAADEATLVGGASQPAPTAASQVSLGEMIEALNRVSEGATPFLGKIIVANTWKQSRPAHPWLAQFDIQKDGHLAMVPPSAEPLTAEQEQWIRDWVVAFVERGGRTIRNFRGLVSDHVSPQDRALLFG
ncbi:MAG: hypothetical protein HC929_11945 [Leptolyngbyaceae cyanobacterium SM2_5_2]|nr:hypothetical protein [Leptolyngbyaceae cyanobacterium SM2_5_2]